MGGGRDDGCDIRDDGGGPFATMPWSPWEGRGPDGGGGSGGGREFILYMILLDGNICPPVLSSFPFPPLIPSI